MIKDRFRDTLNNVNDNSSQLGTKTGVSRRKEKCKHWHKSSARGVASFQRLMVQVVTVIATADSNSGLLIYFQGQRLAVSPEMAECIEVLDLGSLDDKDLVSLDSIPLKKSGVVVKLNGSKELRRRLMDMGLTRNTIVTVQQIAPLGDPVELTLRGYKLSLRKSEAANIMVKEASL